MEKIIFLSSTIVISLLAFGFAFLLYAWLRRQPAGSDKIESICRLIRQGANTFLRKEYAALAKFAGILALIILVLLPKPIWTDGGAGWLTNLTMAIAYIFGNVFSAIAGKVGIFVATSANGRTATAAKKGIKDSFMVGFRGGSVMGMAVVGSSILGISLLFWLTGNSTSLLGFSFGASSLALFAKAGGGIFTKAADISADLVGKVELGIPEDDPRNPAVIADNVGDNVGDVAGMGADLFDSHVASMVAALVIAMSIDGDGIFGSNVEMVFSFAGLGLLSSIIGVACARIGKKGNPNHALNASTYVTTGIYVILTGIITLIRSYEWRLWLIAIIGLAVGLIIGITTDYFTNDERRPVRNVTEASTKGPAFTIITGISYGFLSVFPAMVGIGLASLLSFKIGETIGVGYGMFGIAMAAVGMLSIVGMIISNDAYGPIVDNARGLAEMGGLGDEVLAITDKLDSAGNTVKAITKGFSIGAAGLTVIALLGAFISEVNSAAIDIGLVLPGEAYLKGFDIMDPLVFFGLLVGASLPAIFSALLMLGVKSNAELMVKEIHRQFKEIIGLQEGKEGVLPEYDKCITIATQGSLKELIKAGVVAIVLTLIVGFVGGVKAIGGFLVGNIVTGLLLALFMSNSGGLWDNGKKYIEAGNFGGKGSFAHKAAVVGDTVGDPFKDTAGPSLNTQITVVSLLSSLFSTLFLMFSIF